MTKRVRANGQALVHARYQITGGCDTDKNFIVAAVYHAATGELESREFRQHKIDALRAAEWFHSLQVELVIIESTANYHLLYYDTLREQGVNIAVINPLVVKSLLRIEGKSDKGDAMTLARLAASFDLKTSNMPDLQQRELRLLFKRIDAWKVQRTQTTNRANGILTGLGFTVFRLVPINSPTGFRILQGIIDRRSPSELALLHPRKLRRPEIEKCAAVTLPDFTHAYLNDVIQDVHALNLRIEDCETELLAKIGSWHLNEPVALMRTVPGVTPFLALRTIAELGANFHQRYYSAEAFSKAIGVVPSNEVSGGKLLKRRASHGNIRLKFHLLSAAKSYSIHGKGPLHAWYASYKARTNFRKATSALARRIAEGLWWVMVRHEPFRYWQQRQTAQPIDTVQLGNLQVDPSTGEILDADELESSDC